MKPIITEQPEDTTDDEWEIVSPFDDVYDAMITAPDGEPTPTIESTEPDE